MVLDIRVLHRPSGDIHTKDGPGHACPGPVFRGHLCPASPCRHRVQSRALDALQTCVRSMHAPDDQGLGPNHMLTTTR